MNIYRETARLLMGGTHSSSSSSPGKPESESPDGKRRMSNDLKAVPSPDSPGILSLSRSNSASKLPGLKRANSCDSKPRAALSPNPRRAIGLPHLLVDSSAFRSDSRGRSHTPTLLERANSEQAALQLKSLTRQNSGIVYSLGLKKRFLPSTIEHYKDLFDSLHPNPDGYLSRTKVEANLDILRFESSLSPATLDILSVFVGTTRGSENCNDRPNKINFEDFFNKLCKLGLSGDGSIEKSNYYLRDLVRALDDFAEELNKNGFQQAYQRMSRK